MLFLSFPIFSVICIVKIHIAPICSSEQKMYLIELDWLNLKHFITSKQNDLLQRAIRKLQLNCVTFAISKQSSLVSFDDCITNIWLYRRIAALSLFIRFVGPNALKPICELTPITVKWNTLQFLRNVMTSSNDVNYILTAVIKLETNSNY